MSLPCNCHIRLRLATSLIIPSLAAMWLKSHLPPGSWRRHTNCRTLCCPCCNAGRTHWARTKWWVSQSATKRAHAWLKRIREEMAPGGVGAGVQTWERDLTNDDTFLWRDYVSHRPDADVIIGSGSFRDFDRTLP